MWAESGQVPETTVTIVLWMFSDIHMVAFITIFLPAFIWFRTIKRALPSLLGGG